MTKKINQEAIGLVSLDLKHIPEDHWSEDGEPVTKTDLARSHLNAKVKLIELLSEPSIVVKCVKIDDNSLTVKVIELSPDEQVVY